MSTFIKKYYQYIAVIISAVLALTGFSIYYSVSTDWSFLLKVSNVIYSTLRLFIFENDFDYNNVNAAIQIARFAAPASLAIAAISGILTLFSHTINTSQVKRYNKHIIFAGDNNNLKPLVKEQEVYDKQYVVANFEGKQLHGLPEKYLQIDLDSITQDTFKKLALYNARYIVISYQDDLQSVELAKKLIDKLDLVELQQLVEIILVFNSPEWSEITNDLKLFEELNKEVLENPYLNIRYINYHDKFIRKVMLENAPDSHHPVLSPEQESPRVLVVDFNEISKRLIIGMALNCHYINLKRLKVYVSGGKSDVFLSFVQRYQLDNMLDIVHLPSERIRDINYLVDTIYLCNSNSRELYQCLADIQINPALTRATKITCTQNDYGMLLAKQGIEKSYSVQHEINSLAVLIDDTIDEMAFAIHESYLKEMAANEGRNPQEIDTHREWESLTDEGKDRNRYPADHFHAKIRSMGGKIVDNNQPGDPLDILTNRYLEQLSEVEHLRWMAYMYYKGWRWNVTRDNKLKLHPDIRPYSDLTKRDKDKDLANIKIIPELLAKYGKKIIKA